MNSNTFLNLLKFIGEKNPKYSFDTVVDNYLPYRPQKDTNGNNLGVLDNNGLQGFWEKVDDQGKRHGNFTNYRQLLLLFPPTVARRGNFKFNKPIGTHTFYNTEGGIESIFRYDDDGLFLSREEYHDNGNLANRVNFIQTSEGSKPDGLVQAFWYEGGLKNTVNFENGEKNGKEIEYNKNGTKRVEVDWKDGKLNGYWITYGIGGKVLGKTKYVNDKQVDI
jgi:antitoxin component YwqK of YwqJK toxin-antitoxin module